MQILQSLQSSARSHWYSTSPWVTKYSNVLSAVLRNTCDRM